MRTLPTCSSSSNRRMQGCEPDARRDCLLHSSTDPCNRVVRAGEMLLPVKSRRGCEEQATAPVQHRKAWVLLICRHHLWPHAQSSTPSVQVMGYPTAWHLLQAGRLHEEDTEGMEPPRATQSQVRPGLLCGIEGPRSEPSAQGPSMPPPRSVTCQIL